MEFSHSRCHSLGILLLWNFIFSQIQSQVFFGTLTLVGPDNGFASCLAPYCYSTNAELLSVNTLRPRQNGRHFADDILKCIFLNENVWIPTEISLKFVPKGPINNIPALVQMMAWRRSGDKPLSEPVMVRLPTYICVTRPQWVKYLITHCSEVWFKIYTFSFKEMQIKCHLQNIFIQGNVYGNVVCQMVAIFFQTQCVDLTPWYIDPVCLCVLSGATNTD